MLSEGLRSLWNPLQVSGIVQLSTGLQISPSYHRHLSLRICVINPQSTNLGQHVHIPFLSGRRDLCHWTWRLTCYSLSTFHISQWRGPGQLEPRTEREAALESWNSGRLGKSLLCFACTRKGSAAESNPAPGRMWSLTSLCLPLDSAPFHSLSFPVVDSPLPDRSHEL